MLVSVCQRYNVAHNVRTKAGTLHKGGYPNHPCTRWAGDSFLNADWLLRHGIELCVEYHRRYGRVHACREQLEALRMPITRCRFPAHRETTPALAMPDELKSDCSIGNAGPIMSYRRCIANKAIQKPEVFKWARRGAEPSWMPHYRNELGEGVSL